MQNYTLKLQQTDRNYSPSKGELFNQKFDYYENKQSTSNHDSLSNAQQQPQTKLQENDDIGDFDIDFQETSQEKAMLQNKDCKASDNQAVSNSAFPTLNQIQYCIQVLQKYMPEMFTMQVVNIFYKKLFEKLASYRIVIPPQSMPLATCIKEEPLGLKQFMKRRAVSDLHDKSNPSELNASNQHAFKGFSAQTQQNQNQMYTKCNFQSHDINYIRMKIVIQSFCSGEGFEGVFTQLARLGICMEIDRVTYDKILSEALIQTYKKAEESVAIGYKIKQGPIVCASLRTIEKIMVGCRRNLSQPVYSLIFKALLLLCEKRAVIFQKQDAMQLLKGINGGLAKMNKRFVQQYTMKQYNRNHSQQQSQKKSGRRHHKSRRDSQNMKFELHKYWDNEYQRILVDMYRAGSLISQIRDKLCHTYPREMRLFSIAALRSMFFKILRKAIRRLSLQVFKSGRSDLPQLIKLQDQLVKNIINCSQCLPIRRLLVDIYAAEICGPTLLTEVINLINGYAESGGSVKKSAAMMQRFNGI